VQPGGSAQLIGLLLNFFRSNRDGNEPSPIHAPSHLNDATIKGGPHDSQPVDLTGGWMDAGDMIHFIQNAAFATAALRTYLGRTTTPGCGRRSGPFGLRESHPGLRPRNAG
jgi:hypothetical protein